MTATTLGSPDSRTKQHREIAAARFLFRSTRSAPIWLVLRLWLAWQWLDAAWDKMSAGGGDNWLTHPQGLQGFIASANAAWEHRALTHGHPEVPYHWSLSLLNDMSSHALLFSRIVTISELAVGIGLALGCVTGVAAAGGVALNVLYVTSGSAGTNGLFIVVGVLLIVAWRVAGHLGLDYFLLPPPGSRRRFVLRGRGSSVEDPIATGDAPLLQEASL